MVTTKKQFDQQNSYRAEEGEITKEAAEKVPFAPGSMNSRSGQSSVKI